MDNILDQILKAEDSEDDEIHITKKTKYTDVSQENTTQNAEKFNQNEVIFASNSLPRETAGNEISEDEDVWEEVDDEIWEEVDNNVDVNQAQGLNEDTQETKEIKENITISINIPITYDKQNSKKKVYQLNKEQKERMITIHRSFLAAYIAFGLYLNSFHYDSHLKASLLSNIDPNILKKFDLKEQSTNEYFKACLKLLGKWWDFKFRIKDKCCLCSNEKFDKGIKEMLHDAASNLVGCECLKNVLLILIYHVLGLKTRIMFEILTPIIYYPFALEEEKKYFDKEIKLTFFKPKQIWGEVLQVSNQTWIPFSSFDSFKSGVEFTAFPILENSNSKIKKYYLNYVLGFSDTVVDLTSKYVNDFLARHIKLRKRFIIDKGGRDWLKDYLSSLISSGFEESWESITKNQETKNYLKEKLPTNLAGFKNHPLLILARHIPKSSILKPDAKHVALFKGEKVYPRTSISVVKSKKAWWLLGRIITLKFNQSDDMDTLYPDYQTELYIPDNLGDKDISTLKNTYGNFDLFQPNMLPYDMTHLNYPNIAKVAKQVQTPYLEAITGFKFKDKMMQPIKEGIVIKNSDLAELLSYYDEYSRKLKEKECKTRIKKAVNNWKKVIKFVKLRARILNEYKK